MTRRIRKPVKDIDAFRRMISAQGLKATPQRIAIHTAMMELVHASAEQVYEHIIKSGACKISQVSVYNTLSDLAGMGIYARRFSTSNKMFFDINTYKHVHLYDTRNHEIIDIEADDLVELVENGLRGRRFRGYKTDGIDIQILCHPTRKRLI